MERSSGKDLTLQGRPSQTFVKGTAALLQKRLQCRCFPMNFEKFFLNTFFVELFRATTSGYSST